MYQILKKYIALEHFALQWHTLYGEIDRLNGLWMTPDLVTESLIACDEVVEEFQALDLYYQTKPLESSVHLNSATLYNQQ